MLRMTEDNGIIVPKKGKNSPVLGSVAVISGTESDLLVLRELFDFDADDYQKLFTSYLYVSSRSSSGTSLCGPVVGAPYAVMVVENLIAWGAEKIIYLGWCGSISPQVNIGDIVVATSAMIDEGTSGHYLRNEKGQSFPSERLTNRLVLKRLLLRWKFRPCSQWRAIAVSNWRPWWLFQMSWLLSNGVLVLKCLNSNAVGRRPAR